MGNAEGNTMSSSPQQREPVAGQVDRQQREVVVSKATCAGGDSGLECSRRQPFSHRYSGRIQVTDDKKGNPAQTGQRATDADIEQIRAQNEAGILDLLKAYEVVEQHYFAVATAPQPTVTYGSSTATR